MSRLEQQIEFLAVADKLKSVLRKTRPIGSDRYENSAEHSWQVVLAAIVLREHANVEIDLCRVVKMLAIHDIPEIVVGDTFHYLKSTDAAAQLSEAEAARELFATLPEDQQGEFLELWREFEDRQTPEARFAASMDRLMAFILNPRNDGGSWQEFQITAKAALSKNSHISEGAKGIWELVERIIAENRVKGFLR